VVTVDADPIGVILNFMVAAQTVLAIYGTPEEPIDPSSCCKVLAVLLEDPDLLKAQLALAPKTTHVTILGEQSHTSFVF